MDDKKAEPTKADRMSSSGIARILLVDDHPILRKGIGEVIASESGLEVCGEAGTLSDAYTAVGKLKPDMVIVDISLDGNNGVELMKELTYRWPDLPLLAYSMHDESIYAERALRAGAKGYVMKQHPPERLIEAIKQVLKGKVYLSPAMSDRLLGKLVGAGATGKPLQSPIEKLSDRELEVLQLIGKGMTTAQIAEKLCLSVKTIETYREHLKQKLSLGSGPELVRYAIEWSLANT
ncbi:MAG TPA: response regulator transcription factor, partial [Tepidisphaeraceae bacterium]|nr:response regulator transcription factor [Tepidisphaeraceae bacterium]